MLALSLKLDLAIDELQKRFRQFQQLASIILCTSDIPIGPDEAA